VYSKEKPTTLSTLHRWAFQGLKAFQPQEEGKKKRESEKERQILMASLPAEWGWTWSSGKGLSYSRPDWRLPCWNKVSAEQEDMMRSVIPKNGTWYSRCDLVFPQGIVSKEVARSRQKPPSIPTTKGPWQL
jgi:hypothetical protein